MTAAGPPDHPQPRCLQGVDWLIALPTRTVLGALTAAGAGARVVGGAVRNAVLGRPVADIDIATTAPPGEVMRLASLAGLKTVPTGLSHGTVTVISGSQPFEVTTLRRDIATDGRHATVAFTDDWEADARRRDFTINALYCDADGTIFDPVGGLNDLALPRVRFIGDPEARIAEDALRILRFFRFTAEYVPVTAEEAGFDADGLAACQAMAGTIASLSPERVRAELLKILAAPGATAACRVMRRTGILDPALGIQPDVNRLAGLIRMQQSLGLPPDPLLRLAALAAVVPNAATHLRTRLRLSNAEVERLARTQHRPLSQQAISNALADNRAARKLLYGIGPHKEAFIDQLLLGLSVPNAAGIANVRALLDLAAHWQRPVPPFTGDDVMALGVPEGPAVGLVLAAFNRWWVAQDFPARGETTFDALERVAFRVLSGKV